MSTVSTQVTGKSASFAPQTTTLQQAQRPLQTLQNIVLPDKIGLPSNIATGNPLDNMMMINPEETSDRLLQRRLKAFADLITELNMARSADKSNFEITRSPDMLKSGKYPPAPLTLTQQMFEKRSNEIKEIFNTKIKSWGTYYKGQAELLTKQFKGSFGRDMSMMNFPKPQINYAAIAAQAQAQAKAIAEKNAHNNALTARINNMVAGMNRIEAITNDIASWFQHNYQKRYLEIIDEYKKEMDLYQKAALDEEANKLLAESEKAREVAAKLEAERVSLLAQNKIEQAKVVEDQKNQVLSIAETKEAQASEKSPQKLNPLAIVGALAAVAALVGMSQ